MQLLAQEYAERAASAPGDLAVIDPLGEHTVGEVMARPTCLATALEDSLGGCPDGAGPGRQHLADPGDGARRGPARRHGGGAQQPRRRGGVRAGDGGHRAGRGSRLRRRARALGRPSEAFPDKRAALDGWTLVTSGGPVSDVGPLGRRRRRRDDLRLDRPPQVRRAVRGLAAVRRPVDHRRDRAAAGRRRRRLRPALVGGGVLLRDVPAGDARRSDGLHRDVAARRRAGGDGDPRRPLDDAGADDGPAALGPSDGTGPALVPEGDDRRRWPHGRRRAGSRRAGPRHAS